ncbi:predicted protein [Sclerotinia sclerotiorum 1980 UF-70]|uniref:Uncharacterized protein n=1 Tax=Sclerotinia sclerotiorum (strain ATCC 18683 / 1980 / Ss-1) TaxID=665079 RepID=A7EYG0_SCLS1|nr:predicted protein [Sclerotinia sclerotiorum 1980 UF-70]EDN94502.1 predicted protein [Sclerotinia sclerotiorum 1980 UF-70]
MSIHSEVIQIQTQFISYHKTRYPASLTCSFDLMVVFSISGPKKESLFLSPAMKCASYYHSMSCHASRTAVTAGGTRAHVKSGHRLDK